MTKVNHRLREAAEEGDEELIKTLLLKPQCNPKDADSRGVTALMCAAENGHASCMQLLLPVSDCSATDNTGWTALMFAAVNGNTLCVQFLLPVSDVLAKTPAGRTASLMATSNGYVELGQLIDAYALAISELAALQSFTLPTTAGKTRSLRV